MAGATAEGELFSAVHSAPPSRAPGREHDQARRHEPKKHRGATRPRGWSEGNRWFIAKFNYFRRLHQHGPPMDARRRVRRCDGWSGRPGAKGVWVRGRSPRSVDIPRAPV